MKQLTDEKRVSENIAFLNEPCKFRQYINEDGTVGKVYNLDGGATIKINDADFIPVFEKAEREFRNKNKAFHKKLLSMGAKAYRSNDGWVDRKNCKVTFFHDDKTYGYYWGNMNLQKGNMIFIGNEDFGGRFATIEEKVDEWEGSTSYTYSPTDIIINGTYGPYKTRNNLTKIDKILLFLGKDLHLRTDIFNEERK